MLRSSRLYGGAHNPHSAVGAQHATPAGSICLSSLCGPHFPDFPPGSPIHYLDIPLPYPPSLGFCSIILPMNTMKPLSMCNDAVWRRYTLHIIDPIFAALKINNQQSQIRNSPSSALSVPSVVKNLRASAPHHPAPPPTVNLYRGRIYLYARLHMTTFPVRSIPPKRSPTMDIIGLL